MSTRYLKTKTKAKKGISPVIATVILVAVAVVIAAAMAGFAGSLFGTYQNTAQIQVKEATLLTDGSGTVTILNKGGSQDAVVSITVAGTEAIDPLVGTLPANSETVVPFVDVTDGLSTFDVGQQVTMKIKLGSGQEVLQSISVE